MRTVVMRVVVEDKDEAGDLIHDLLQLGENGPGVVIELTDRPTGKEEEKLVLKMRG